MYIENFGMRVKLDFIGFVSCSTNNEGGALYIKCHTMQIQHICAFLCEAPSYSYQFARFDSNAEQENNKLSYLAIVSCGLSSTGRTSFGVCGNSLYTVENFNSSNNYNIIDSTSFGTCFSTNDIKYHRTSFVNFLNSKGYDVMNTNFIDFPKKGNGTFTDGNVYNCTTKCIFQFRGINFINNFRFGKLIYDTSFIVGATAKFGHTLTFSNSKIDIMPTKIDTNVKINGGCSLEDPIVTLNIVHEGTEKCQLPTVIFTESEKFTMSLPFLPTSVFSPSKEFSQSVTFSATTEFTSSESFSPSSEFSSSDSFSPSNAFTSSDTFIPSSKFTSSIIFSPSSEFSESESFSPSDDFTSSNSFSPLFDFLPRSLHFTTSSAFSASAAVRNATDPFTQSSPFSPSFTFRPNATKYPDGLDDYKRANVSGRGEEKKATAAEIGATAGFSFVFIIVAVVLMLLYLRNKKKHLKGHSNELDDAFLVDDQSSSGSYSYSYYTYSYWYSYNSRSSSFDDYSRRDPFEYSSDVSYSDFEGTYISLSD